MTLLPILFSIGALGLTLLGSALVLRWKSWPEKNLWRLLAFGSGILLGTTFLHLLPEALSMNAKWCGGAVLTAFVIFFVTEEFTVVHPCGEMMGHCHMHSLGYGALIALFIHSLSDGLAMAVSFISSVHLGITVSGALLVHKFSDGITLSSLFRGSGATLEKTWTFTIILALATPLGVFLGLGLHPWLTPNFHAGLLGLAAGGFLYISAADLLPRLHRARDVLCWVYLILGIGVVGLGAHN